MSTLQVAHTADLDPATLGAAHGLLRDVFEGDLTDHDWEHCLGGMHALAWDDGQLVGHASVVMRRLLHGGRALRTGYVEGVGVRADRRRRGHAAAMMSALERIIRGAYDAGALGATEDAIPLYAGRGWLPWRGETWASTPGGQLLRTPDEDDCIFVLAVAAPLDLDDSLTCDWREGDGW
ncbi:MAG: GNAT family N-acetyltransferase [Marmoricola sp.]